MNRSKPIATRCTLIAALTLLAFQQAGAAVQWSQSLAVATASAKKRGCLMMVVFYKKGSNMSDKLMNGDFADADVIAGSSAVECLRVDISTNADIAKEVHVGGYPTVFFIDPQNRKFTEIDGYVSAGRLSVLLKSFARAWSLYPEIEARLKANPKDGIAAAKMVVVDAMRSAPAAAAELIPNVKANAPNLLAASYNAIGDAYNSDDQDDAARPWYNLTLGLGSPVQEVVNAHLGLYEIADDSNDKTAMKAELNAILTLPNLPDDVKSDVKAKLAAVSGAK